MKNFIAILIFLSSGVFTFAQSNDSAVVSAENEIYMEWVSKQGFRFISEVKEGQPFIDGAEILGTTGESLSDGFNKQTFDITMYDFDTVIAPEKNIIIKASDDTYIFVKSKQRQEALFKRYLINHGAKK